MFVVPKYPLTLNFCKDCRIFCEGEWEIKVNGKVKNNDDQVLTKERPSINKKPCVKQRPRVEERSSIKIPCVDEIDRVCKPDRTREKQALL